ncbi:MAG: FAD:protein FMN transferase [Geminicoccaceae bacterium]
MIRPTRRRLLTIMGAAAGIGLLPSIGRAASAPRWGWRGSALGAKAEMTLVHPDEATAKKLMRLAVDEIERLENIFSLYRPDSEISRLNRDGYLGAPSPDLISLLSTARRISDLTDGAFDVTVQPLWRLYADHFSQPDADPRGPSATAIEEVVQLVGYTAIELEASSIRLARPDMAVTLNGIAQGYITDRIVDLLRAHGIEQTLIDLGEIRALGNRPDGRPWQVAVDGAGSKAPIGLIDRAIATSGSKGTTFDGIGRLHHIFEPASGRPSGNDRSLSVIAKHATLADALSTALVAMPEEKRASLNEHLIDIAVIF